MPSTSCDSDLEHEDSDTNRSWGSSNSMGGCKEAKRNNQSPESRKDSALKRRRGASRKVHKAAVRNDGMEGDPNRASCDLGERSATLRADMKATHGLMPVNHHDYRRCETTLPNPVRSRLEQSTLYVLRQ